MKHEPEKSNLKAERVQFWDGLANAGRATVDKVREFLDGVISAVGALRDVFDRLTTGS